MDLGVFEKGRCFVVEEYIEVSLIECGNCGSIFDEDSMEYDNKDNPFCPECWYELFIDDEPSANSC